MFGVRRPLNKQVLPRRTRKPPRQSEGLRFWTSSLNHILGSPWCRVLRYLYVPLVCQVSHAFFFFCCFLVIFYFKYTHTSTTVVVSGNNIQYWWWRTLRARSHGDKKEKKKMLQQTIKIEQCITVMLNLQKQMYMSTQQKEQKTQRAREEKRHVNLEMHTLSPQWDICFFTSNLKHEMSIAIH